VIDHTILKPEATRDDVARVVAEAIEYRFASVCVAPTFVKQVSAALSGSGVKTCAVIGFPNGTHKPTIKAIEATSTIKDGADEIDVVAHLPLLLALDFEAVRDELMEVVRAARATRADVVIKVIIESAALVLINKERGKERGKEHVEDRAEERGKDRAEDRANDRAEETIALACRAVRESGCDFIKTSTGFHPAGGASVQVVRWMKQYGQSIKVKASGGIRDLPTAVTMLDAGADRLGVSASVAIVKTLRGESTTVAPSSGY